MTKIHSLHNTYKYNTVLAWGANIACLLSVVGSTLYFLICLTDPAHAAFFDRKAEGWHWYEDPKKKKKETPQEPARTSQEKDHKALLEEFKQEISRVKAKALMDPTYENIRDYMIIQKEMMGKASQFAAKWKEVLYTTPELDYTVKHPTSQAGRHIYLDLEKQQMDKAIQGLSKTHGLFFFYSGSCTYCHKFAPIVKAFAQKYGWEVLPISIDGAGLPEFPNFKPDNGTAQTLGVKVLPSLLAVEPSTGQVIPLSYGFSTHDQIEDRIRVLLINRRPS
ncbi:MAG: type-F conjugative transfer system pilin assembly protein TraF [Alphaproteobacteria bacterium]|nr:type-F conjugative transfer system pilin assembly protein TraF [Alphaproteobacteria bacterium]